MAIDGLYVDNPRNYPQLAFILRPPTRVFVRGALHASYGSTDGVRVRLDRYCPLSNEPNPVRKLFTYTGSWGGPNAFNPCNIVDLHDPAVVSVPFNGAVVVRYEGDSRVSNAYNVFIHPVCFDQLVDLLPLTSRGSLDEDLEMALILCQYRADERRRRWNENKRLGTYGPENAELKKLHSMGLIQLGVGKVGRVTITTAGKNLLRAIPDRWSR